MQLSESEHLDPAEPLASELAAEQRHVDRVYEALRQAEAEARGVEALGEGEAIVRGRLQEGQETGGEEAVEDLR